MRRLLTQCRQCEPAERTQPVIERNEHNAMRGEFCTIIHRLCAAAECQRTAVNPNDNRCFVRMRWRPDIKRQTILTHFLRVVGIDAVRRIGGLNATRTKCCCVAHALPGRGLNWWPPSQFASWRLDVRNILECFHTVGASPPCQHALRNRDNGARIVCCRRIATSGIKRNRYHQRKARYCFRHRHSNHCRFVENLSWRSEGCQGVSAFKIG